MNSEIKSVVEHMKRGKKEALASSDVLVYQLGQMAHLLSLLSEEAAAQSEKISKQTDQLIKLTDTIMWFTVVLIIIGIVQIFQIVTRS